MTHPAPKPWDKTIFRIFGALILALTTLLVSGSYSGAVFVFAIILMCRTWNDIKVLIYAGIIAITFRTFAYEPFHIPSGSMKSGLLVGDYLFVSKSSYGYSRHSFPFSAAPIEGRIGSENRPKRGDVVVFRLPRDTKLDYIKRVMGLPGDKIQVKKGIVHINGVPLEQTPAGVFLEDEDSDHVRSIAAYQEKLPEGKNIAILKERNDDWPNNTNVYEVPPGHYFVMGDNRDNSRDSRFLGEVGFVPEENIVGRADIIFISLDGGKPRWNRFLQMIH